MDELLNSLDDYNPSEVHDLPLKVGREELEVYERRVKHLTVLLADAERDIAKLTQLNKILKEDIRRQQRSFEREQHANNFEYLKNVVFKVIVYYVPRRIMRVITRRATMLAGNRSRDKAKTKPRRDQSCEHFKQVS